MSSQSNEVREYLVKQYIKQNLLDKAGNRVIPENQFNPFVYPDDGYIPYCKTCQSDYEKFKSNTSKQVTTAEMEHNDNCLWYSYFANKIYAAYPSIRIVAMYDVTKAKKK